MSSAPTNSPVVSSSLSDAKTASDEAPVISLDEAPVISLDEAPVISLDEDEVKGNKNFDADDAAKKHFQWEAGTMESDERFGKHANETVKIVVTLDPNAKLTEKQQEMITDRKKVFTFTKRQIWIAEKWNSMYVSGNVDPKESELEETCDVGRFLGIDLVVEYLKHHDGVTGKKPHRPYTNDNYEDQVDDKWDARFSEKCAETGLIYEVIQAAHNWGVMNGVHILCGFIAMKMRHKQKEEVKKIIDDFGEKKSEKTETKEEEKK
jgi:hypothetical protein